VLVGEAGRERALMWRMMDAMERRRRWREGKSVLQAWRAWFSAHVRARVKRLLHSRRCLRQLFLHWADAVAGEKESMRQRDLTVALEARLETHRVRERERERHERKASDALMQWAGVAAVGMGVAPPSPTASPHISLLEAQEVGAGVELDLSRIASVESGRGGAAPFASPPPAPVPAAADATSPSAHPATVPAASHASRTSASGGDAEAKALQPPAYQQGYAQGFERGWLAFASRLQGAQEDGARARSQRTTQEQEPSPASSGVELSAGGLLALFVRAWSEFTQRRILSARLVAACVGAVDTWRRRFVEALY